MSPLKGALPFAQHSAEAGFLLSTSADALSFMDGWMDEKKEEKAPGPGASGAHTGADWVCKLSNWETGVQPV